LSTSGANPQPAARIPRWGWVVAFLAATALIAGVYSQFSSTIQARRPASMRLDPVAQVPEFRFQAQDGLTVTPADLKGNVWVANFIFTRCLGPCPVMTSRMAELNQRLGSKTKDVKLVSFTVDPDFDTPAVLKAYGEKVGASPEKWRFLTGPKDQMEATVAKGFLQPLSNDSGGMPVHSTRFVIIDRKGWIRGFQDGNDPEVVQKLLMDIGDILREPSGAEPKK